jgi:hypothetical protein
VADHVVDADVSSWQLEAFRDLYRWLRWNLPPERDQRAQREGELLEQIGDWVSEQLLGRVALELARARGREWTSSRAWRVAPYCTTFNSCCWSSRGGMWCTCPGTAWLGGLMLETDTGTHDLISTDELVDLLDCGSDQLKLVTLSACESAAATAQELCAGSVNRSGSDGDPHDRILTGSWSVCRAA